MTFKETNLEPIAKLNIGGTIFLTFKTTLAKIQSEILGKFDRTDTVFIDRNPHYFSYVLDYLRWETSKTTNTFDLPNDETTLRCHYFCKYNSK